MRELTKKEIEILKRHAKWLKNEKGGERANLRGAYLRGAYLRGSDLQGAAGKILSFGSIGSRQEITYVTKTEQIIHIRCGCFYGTLEEFTAKVEEKHGDSQHGKSYKAAIEFIKAHDAACWQDDAEK
ncbi:pentapeptide repeat-containing protein [uncultured Bilophila sp.]|uniref:pentapeptide repeat-containing protein n=1 Tax=uncultured Bilophila sp. TaxID=529385 RepID=UPI00266F8BB0|nr:pentapeptide repeat-containing protein [uncultured Bilophila sp.]